METEVIPPFADEVELLLVAESLFEMEAGSRVLAVLNLLHQCMQDAFLVLCTDMLHVFIQSAGPAFGQGFDFLCGGQGGGGLVEAFELLEQVDEQVRFRFLFPLSREEGMQH